MYRMYSSSCEESYFFICHKSQTWGYKFIPQSKTWSEARQYCRNEYYDLAIFRSRGDVDSAVTEEEFPVWTGLHRDGTDKHKCNLSCFCEQFV